MRTADTVQARLQDLFVAEFDRRTLEAKSRLPHLCVNNHRQPLDTRKQVDDDPNPQFNRVAQVGTRLPVLPTLGLCMLGSNDPEEWAGTICEDPIDAQRCPSFQSKLTKEKVQEEFLRDIADAEWLRANLPEAVALLWVLEEASTAQIPWWRRALFWLLPMKVPPVVKVQPSTHLLPESTHGNDSA